MIEESTKNLEIIRKKIAIYKVHSWNEINKYDKNFGPKYERYQHLFEGDQPFEHTKDCWV